MEITSQNTEDHNNLKFVTFHFILQGGPQKCPFFFGNNFYKNKETSKIFSPQILEVYRILLV